ncbi:MAG: glycosyltransferase [Saprospiraceae bacterium]|nr:glycosyltransferase [Saprospiraceae bacterium]
MSQICMIIPCFNEANRLKVSDFERFLQDHARFDLLFVNDGSTDETANLINVICSKNANAMQLSLDKNSGKAEAIRQGFLHILQTQNHYCVGYLDADLATPFSEILKMETTMKQYPSVKILLGSRWKRLGSKIERNWMRHYMGRIFATMVSMIFNLDVYDTQCGAKIMQAESLEPIFEDPFVSRWFFDIEILLRIRRLNPDKSIDDWAMEWPINEWKEIGNSRISLFDFLSVPYQLWKIKRHYPILP